jgi:hypothetical protein
MGYQGTFLGVKGPERELHHSHPCTDEVKNEWSYTSTPPVRLHGVDRDKYNFQEIFFRERLCTVGSYESGISDRPLNFAKFRQNSL